MLVGLLKYLRNNLKVLVVSLFILTDLIAYYYLGFQKTPAKDRCSKEFSEFENILDIYVVLPDGSIQDESGEVYPPGAFNTDNDVVWGCPCSIRQCLSKCCPVGQAFNRQNRCVDIDRPNHFPDLIEVFHYEDETLYIRNVTQAHFSILINKCSNRMIPQDAQNFLLLDDGRIWDKHLLAFLDQSEYCIDGRSKYILDAESPLTFVRCFPTEEEFHVWNLLRLYRYIYASFKQSLIVFINLMTFSVFAVLPQLHRGYGKSIMCYLLSRALLNLNLAMSYIGEATENYILCTASAPFKMLVDLSSRAWQVDVSYTLWELFKPGTIRVHEANDSGDFKRFLIHSALAWGVPLVLVCVPLAGHHIPGSPEFIQPHWDTHGCSWTNTHLLWACFIIPIDLCTVISTVLCVLTLRHLHASQKTSEALQKANSRTHNRKHIQWSSLYIKVCLLMGVMFITTEIFNLMSWAMAFPAFIHWTIITIDTMRGVEVFIIFVCKKDILQAIAQKIFKRRINNNQQ